MVPPPRAQGRTHLVAGLWAGGRGVTALQSEAGSLSRRGQVACPAPKPGLTAWRSATHPGLLPGVSGGTSAHSSGKVGDQTLAPPPVEQVTEAAVRAENETLDQSHDTEGAF